MHRRLKKLENIGGTNEDKITLFCWASVVPSENGPVDLGVNHVCVVASGHPGFHRRDYPTDQAFKDAVDKLHLKIHGKPTPWGEDKKFDDGSRGQKIVGSPGDAISEGREVRT